LKKLNEEEVVVEHKKLNIQQNGFAKRIKDCDFRSNINNTLIITVCYSNRNAKEHEMHIGIALRAVASLM
jgi:hypothetical protein